MTTQHTPGPWKVGTKYKNDIISGSTHLIIARVMLQNLEYEANASVIAAAPDLLAVVQELEDSAAYWGEYDVPCGIVDRLRAAIEKATGATT